MADKSKRTETPDLMSDLMTAGYEEKQPRETAVRTERETAAPQPQRGRPPKPEEEKSDNVKVTAYLSPEIADLLDRAWTDLRLMIGRENRAAVTKSLVVETCLKLILEELNSKQERSRIAKAIQNTLK